jgi:MFS family permease
MSSSQIAPKPLQIVAAVIGNALEWYDFIVFGFFTVVIARLFFPSDSQYASLLLTTGTFGVGFFMRPVGGILLGIYADRRGRKAALLMVISLMTVAIAMIAFAPTYAAIGVAAPLIMVVARLLQGFSAGGEFASATAFLTESAPAGRRGLYGSWQMVGQGLAVLLGAILGALLTRSLTPETLDSWGWRIPFLFGLIIGPVGLYIRRKLDETSAFLQSNRSSAGQQGAGSVLMSHVKEMLTCLGMVVSGTISFYVILIYIPTFARTQLHLPLDQAFLAQSIGLACEVVLIPICGVLSDFVGRKPVMITALVLDLLVTYPQPVWRLQRPDIDGIGRAIPDSRALDRARHRLQHRGHAVWRLCTVLRDLADPSDRHADRPGILSDVRRCGWTAGSLFPQGTSSRCQIFGHGRRRTHCRLAHTAPLASN